MANYSSDCVVVVRSCSRAVAFQCDCLWLDIIALSIKDILFAKEKFASALLTVTMSELRTLTVCFNWLSMWPHLTSILLVPRKYYHRLLYTTRDTPGPETTFLLSLSSTLSLNLLTLTPLSADPTNTDLSSTTAWICHSLMKLGRNVPCCVQYPIHRFLYVSLV